MNTEHIDIDLARYSDWAFTTSVVVLVGALLLLAVELVARHLVDNGLRIVHLQLCRAFRVTFKVIRNDQRRQVVADG